MKVALINQYFPPDGSATAAVFGDLVSALVEGGHGVVVVCGKPSYQGGGPHPAASTGETSREPIEVRRVRSFAFSRMRIVGRILNYLSFLISAFWTLRRQIGADVLIAGTDPPLAIAVAALGARGVPIVYNVQDLHPDAAIAGGLLSPGIAAHLWERVHRWGLRRADRIVVIGRDMKERIISKGIPPEKIEVVSNGAREAVGAPDPAVVQRLRGDVAFLALHAGNIGSAVPWEAIAAANELLPARRLQLAFIGEGVFADQLEGRGVRVLPYVARDDIPSVMAAGDLQIVALRDGLEGLMVPSKLYTALSYGRPVLAVVPPGSEVALVVREYKCGVVVSPVDPHGIASAITEAADDPDRMRAMGANAKAAGEQFRRRVSMDAIAAVAEALVDPRS